jgi:tRNA/rRNA methyltransferase
LSQNSQNNIHIVLVEPEESLNIGSVARAMVNFGFKNLHLVAAAYLLEQLTVHNSLEEALKNMHEVVGFSTRSGQNRFGVHTLSAWVEEYLPKTSGDIALLFGPEDTGLRQEHLDCCRWFIRIPTNEEYQSLNLSHAVALALYAIRSAKSPARHPTEADEDLPTWNDFFQLDRILDSVMEQSEFVRPGTPEPVPRVLKSMLRRLTPSTREMGMLLAFFGRMDRVLKRRDEKE